MILETVYPLSPIKLFADYTNLFIFSNTVEDLQADAKDIIVVIISLSLTGLC